MDDGIANDLNDKIVRRKIERLVISGFVLGGVMVGLIITLVALSIFARGKNSFYPIILIITPVLFVFVLMIRSKVIRYKKQLVKSNS